MEVIKVYILMKKIDTQWKTLLIAVGVAAVTCGAQAGPIAYTSEYIPNALPSTSGGTVANPSWDYSHTAAGTYSASVTDGILSASTLPGIANTQSWKIGQMGSSIFGTSSAWAVTPATGATIDFTIKVTGSTGQAVSSPQIQGGFNIFVGDGTKYASVYFNTTGISVWGHTIASNTTHINTGFQTYRIAFANGLLSLYEAGNETALFSNIAMVNTAGYNQMYWGDATGLASGSFQLSQLGWNNTVADFSAPISAVPEPGTVALLLIGGLVLFVKGWRYLGVRQA